jgi:hypothetical protein
LVLKENNQAVSTFSFDIFKGVKNTMKESNDVNKIFPNSV